jgi:hypothetical protein
MEGHVFDIGVERVAKVWFSKTPEELVQLQAFYETVRALQLPFETPLITEVHDSPTTSISIERALQGTPLNDVVDRDARVPPSFATDAITSVLTALRDHPVQDITSVPPILGGVSSSEAKTNSPGAMLAEAAHGKVERYGDQLRRSVRNFDWVYAQIIWRPQPSRSSVINCNKGAIGRSWSYFNRTVKARRWAWAPAAARRVSPLCERIGVSCSQTAKRRMLALVSALASAGSPSAGRGSSRIGERCACNA